MSTRKAYAEWTGTLKDGKGVMKFGSFEGPYTAASRFEEGEGTNPEELVGAAHAGCYSMFLSALISKLDLVPERIDTTASVVLERLEDGPKIVSIRLDCKAKVPGISEADFQEQVQIAKQKCPISKLFTGTDIQVEAKLVS